MFAVGRATMRVQVFTGEQVPPALVLSQTQHEGVTLVNGIEKFAEAAWRRLLADVDEAPIVIQYMIPTASDEEWFSMWQTVTFDVGPHRGLSNPRFTVIPSPDQVVGATVAADRGERFVPRPPEPAAEIVYRVVSGADLPIPLRLDFPCMKTPATPTRSWWRPRMQRSPQSTRLRSCCWYHRGDWVQASRTAISLVHEAIAAKVPSQDIAHEVVRTAKRNGIVGWQLEAVGSLVLPATAIVLSGDDDYTNGQHRAWVMREQHVPSTITIC